MGRGESDIPVCSTPASFSVHVAKSDDYVGAYVGTVEEIMCVVCVGNTVFMDVIWRRVCLNMI